MSSITAHNFKRIALFGAGLSGLAAYRRARDLGISCVIDDDHQKAHDEIAPSDFIAWQKWDFSELDALILSPGIAHHHPAPHDVAIAAIAQGVEIISEVEFGLRTGHWGKLVIITGTNGKSTTTALTGHILAYGGKNVGIGGNLGTPLCALDDRPDGITVLELSSYQLETTPSLAPHITALLNITPDHLDRHGGLDGYIAAKKKSLSACGPKSLALIGDEGDMMADIIKWAKAELPCDIKAINANNLDQLALDNPYLAGAHNAQNAAFAIAIARACGVSDADCGAALASFVGLAHRLQPVGTINGISFVNDSKATNGDASAKALGAYQTIIWLAGGRAKADGLAACHSYFNNIHSAHFYGECADIFYDDFHQEAQGHIPCTSHNTMDEAFSQATKNIPEEAVILLSPAAASFDQFANFGARGSHFEGLATSFIAKIAPCDANAQGGSSC